jgi:ribosomal protein S5
LVAENETRKILELAGIKDIWSTTKGQTGSKNNMIIAVEKALKQLMATKVQPKYTEKLNIIEGNAGET